MPETDGDTEVAQMVDADNAELSEGVPNPYKDRIWTIPNVICIGRLIGSFALLALAVGDHATAFVVAYIILHLSDWVDGKLARWLNQRSDFGARLDSVSDGVLDACLLLGCLILKWDVLQNELPWLATPVIAYFCAAAFGFLKYRRIPSYHTYGAKWTMWLVLAGALSMLLDWSLVPMKVASVAGTLTNLESACITWVLPEWHADVLSLRHALKEDPASQSAE